MAMISGSLYDALRAANVPDDKALKAAEEATGYDRRLQRMETDLGILKWTQGITLVIVLAFFGTFLTFALNHLTFH